jgi:hypothetical protein
MNDKDRTSKVINDLADRGDMILTDVFKGTETGEADAEAKLMELIQRNVNTEFGLKHHFSEIHSLEDYRKSVPLLNYDDLEPYISRMFTKNEQDILTTTPIVRYAQTSGSTGVPKHIPVSRKDMQLASTMIYVRSFSLARKYCKENNRDFTCGKGLFFLDLNALTSPCGLPISGISSTFLTAFQEDYADLSVAPTECLYPDSTANMKYVLLLFALAEKDLFFVFSVFASLVYDKFCYMQSKWEMLCDDLEKGRIDPSISIPKEQRTLFESKLQADPERAAELREEFGKGFDTPICPRIWKNLRWVTAIGAGVFTPYRMRMKEFLGEDIPVDTMAYTASEGFFAFPTKMNSNDFLLDTQGCFFEFIPVNSVDETPLTMDKLTVGECYELIITTPSGLYRYRINDIVQVTGYYNQNPYIKVAYRKNMVANIVGENTAEEEFNMAISGFEEETGLSVLEYSVYIDLDTQASGRYVIFMECDAPASPEIDYAEIIDRRLQKLSSIFKYYREHGTIDPCVVHFVQPQTYMLYREMMEMRGASPNQVKPVRLIDNPFKEDFFFALVDS